MMANTETLAEIRPLDGTARRFAGSRLPALDTGLITDLLARAALAGWFLLLSTACLGEILRLGQHAASAGIDALGAARLLSKLSLFSFLVLIVGLAFLRHRAVAKADGWAPRIAALLGTYFCYALSFLPANTGLGLTGNLASALLLLAGNALAATALFHLGRSFSIMPEARRLVTGGPYALIRHPLYLAELIALLGVFLQFASWAAAGILALQCVFQLLRMRNEEAILAESFPDYADYGTRTARLIPGFW